MPLTFWSLRAIDKVPCMHGRWTKYVGGANLPLKDGRQQKRDADLFAQHQRQRSQNA